MGETVNLASKMPAKTRELHYLLRSWRRSVNAPVPTQKNPRYDPGAQWKPRRRGGGG
jgi:hypothetical protein